MNKSAEELEARLRAALPAETPTPELWERIAASARSSTKAPVRLEPQRQSAIGVLDIAAMISIAVISVGILVRYQSASVIRIHADRLETPGGDAGATPPSPAPPPPTPVPTPQPKPPELTAQEKLEQWILQLGSASSVERDGAEKALLDLRPLPRVALEKAAKSDANPEVSRGAARLLAKLDASTLAPGKSTGNAQVDALIARLRRTNKNMIADALLKQIERRVTARDARHKGHIIVGQVVVDDQKLDPQQVSAQMSILPEGYFSDVVGNLAGAVGFQAHGYYHEYLETQNFEAADVIYVGEVHMRAVKPEETVTLTGKVELDPGVDIHSLEMYVYIEPGPINNLTNGYEGVRGESVRVPVQANGEFKLAGFSPMTYWIVALGKNLVRVSQELDFKPGEKIHDAGVIKVEQKCEISLDFLESKKPPFTGEIQHTTVHGGDYWKSTEKQYNGDVMFEQKQGLKLTCYHVPAFIADLGEKDIKEYINTDPATVKMDYVRELPMQSGHVYLLDQRHYGHWVLFKPSLINQK